MTEQKSNFIFFGTSVFAVELLKKLETFGHIPRAIVTTPDMPAGRKMIMTPPPVKTWAVDHDIQCVQPERLKDSALLDSLKNINAEYFLVAAYGKIIPKDLLTIPPKKTLNIHPSLLPQYRGPSPIQYQIINNEPHIGTSIMVIDEEVDHGSIIAQKEVLLNRRDNELTEEYEIIEKKLALESADLFNQTISKWLDGKIQAIEQNHSKATFTTMIKKADGLIDDFSDQRVAYRKYLAFNSWPETYFFNENNTRVIIKKARFENGVFIIERVTPEGKREMDYQDFKRGLA